MSGYEHSHSNSMKIIILVIVLLTAWKPGHLQMDLYHPYIFITLSFETIMGMCRTEMFSSQTSRAFMISQCNPTYSSGVLHPFVL